jgi:hypothetical protein
LTDPIKKAQALVDIALQLREQASQDSEWLELLMKAGEVSHTIKDNSAQAWALSALGTVLAQAQQWTEAERVISTIKDSSAQAWALRDLAWMMAQTDKLEQLLHLIQHAWQQAKTREEALALFSIASAVISRKPEICILFIDAFSWADTFLDG